MAEHVNDMKSSIELINELSEKLEITSRVIVESNILADIKRDYSNYWDCFKCAKSLPDFNQRVNALQKLLNNMLDEYHPPTFGIYIHDLAYEFSLWDEYKTEDPPYSSISNEMEMASIQFTQAKILLLYSDVRDTLFLYKNMVSESNENTSDEKTKTEKAITINQIKDMKGLILHQEKESRENLDCKLNDQLRTYNKFAKRFLEIKSPQERLQNLSGLLELIADECKSFLDKDTSQKWDYTITEIKGTKTVEKKYKGSPDYELYVMAFENLQTRAQFADMLKNGKLKKMNSSMAELEIHTLYSALKTECKQAEKEVQCMKRSGKVSADVPDHFDLDVPQIKQKLKTVLERMRQYGYVEQSVKFDDFLYMCTGKGRPSNYPIKWLKDDDELGYFVKKFFAQTKSKYKRAARCFLLNNGKEPVANNLRTNATNQNDKQVPINTLVSIVS